jgi:hypothetical protein
MNELGKDPGSETEQPGGIAGRETMPLSMTPTLVSNPRHFLAFTPVLQNCFLLSPQGQTPSGMAEVVPELGAHKVWGGGLTCGKRD